MDAPGLRADGARDTYPGADSAATDAAVASAGCAEWPTLLGPILWVVPRRLYRVEEPAPQHDRRHARGGVGIWRLCAGSGARFGMCRALCRRLRARPAHHLSQYFGGEKVYSTTRFGAGAAQFFVELRRNAVAPAGRVAYLAICAAYTARGLRRCLPVGTNRSADRTAGSGRRGLCNGGGRKRQRPATAAVCLLLWPADPLWRTRDLP